MNVTRTRRRLRAQRRYDNRCGRDPWRATPENIAHPSLFDSRPALKLVRRLANLKYRQGIHDLVRIGILSRPGEKFDTSCGGWTWGPPCGGCDRCIADQQMYYLGRWSDRSRHAGSLIRQ